MIFDDRPCALGEGPLWHPLRQQLFWFDITGKRLLTRTAGGPGEWQFDRMVSAAGWINTDELLIASNTSCGSMPDRLLKWTASARPWTTPAMQIWLTILANWPDPASPIRFTAFE